MFDHNITDSKLGILSFFPFMKKVTKKKGEEINIRIDNTTRPRCDHNFNDYNAVAANYLD